MSKFKPYNTARNNTQLAPANAFAAAAKAKPSTMALTFPGIKVVSAKVTVFVKSNEASLDVEGRMGDAKVSCEVGRLDPRESVGRLDYESVKVWAASVGLEYSHEDEPAISKFGGEEYVVVYLVAKERIAKKAW